MLHIQIRPDERKVIPVQSNFLQAAQDTFSRRAYATLANWQYSDSDYANDPVCGASLWDTFLKDNNSGYYHPIAERELILKQAKLLEGQYNEKTAIVDFGPGPKHIVEQKTLPFVRAIQDIAAYYPVDVSATYLLGAASVVKQASSSTVISPIKADFLKDPLNISAKLHKVGLFMGGTIANIPYAPNIGLPEFEVISMLKKFRMALGERSTLLVAYDGNQNGETVYKSYDHPIQRQFGVNVMQRIKRDLPVFGSYDAEAWVYEPVWYARSSQLCHTVFATRNQSFMLGNEWFDIKRGDSFVLNNSFKYPAQRMSEWAKKAGFKSDSFITEPKYNYTLHAMHA